MTPSLRSTSGVFCTALALSATLAATVLAGCGAAVSPTPSGPTPLVVTGNWALSATSTSTKTNGAVIPIGIVFISTGSTLSGISLFQAPSNTLCSPCCGSSALFSADGHLTGTIDENGNVALKSKPAPDGTILSITAKTTNGTSFDSGAYTVAGGCWTDQGSVTGSQVATLNGTYLGTVKSSVNGQIFGVTAELSQNSTPDTKGELHFTGTAAFTGSPCFTTLALASPTTTTTYFAGSLLTAQFVTAANSSQAVATSGILSPDAKTLVLNYTVNDSGCDSDYGSGTLTLQ